jgi:hypothetical protein
MTPELAALLGDGAELAVLDTARLLALLEEVDASAEALAVVRRRLHAQLQRRLEAQPTHDVYLTLAEAADRLRVTQDWLRRRPQLPFVAKLSDGVVRYSAKRLDVYMAAACRKSRT